MNTTRKVRVRFAPSPTGGLHLGGVRTALFNYLFAKNNGGQFILRIEDTDQSRFVEGAEEYINECLAWCGLNPDESPAIGGPHGPYRQSERKASYLQYAIQLVDQGHAYYAFDTSKELDEQRKLDPNFKYSFENRMELRNSLSLPSSEVKNLLEAKVPYTIRIKMPKDKTIVFEDMIRGKVSFDSNIIDDKVLLKADGMPTYHLAVVVDDHAMEISHVFRGEEWLPSAPIHILLWEYLGWKDKMPKWAHLPLILKPDGHGKLSKRDGDRLGFPVFAMNWTDPVSKELTQGFRELGFLPEAFINILALLGWNDGTEQEIFTKEELIEKFTVARIGKSGAKFDYEKAKWFNHIWINQIPEQEILHMIKSSNNKLSSIDNSHIKAVFDSIKDRLTFITDFWQQSSYFFEQPVDYDISSIVGKWDSQKADFFNDIQSEFQQIEEWNKENIEKLFKDKIKKTGMKVGELMLPFRIMLVGGKFGPDVFRISELLGKKNVIDRVVYGLKQLQ